MISTPAGAARPIRALVVIPLGLAIAWGAPTVPSAAEPAEDLPPEQVAATHLSDGRTITYSVTPIERLGTYPWEKRILSDITMTMVTPAGEQCVLMRHREELGDLASATGGARHYAIVSQERSGDVLLLIVYTGSTRQSPTVDVVGVPVSLARREPPGLPGLPSAEILSRAWSLATGGDGDGPPPMTGVTARAVGDAILLVVHGPDGPVAELAIDPVHRRAMDLLRRHFDAVSTDWDWGAYRTGRARPSILSDEPADPDRPLQEEAP